MGYFSDQLLEYKDKALRTESYVCRQTDNWQSHVPLKLYRVQHALIGITTELGELEEALNHVDNKNCNNVVAWTNVKEELGDLWWYMALLLDASEVDLSVIRLNLPDHHCIQTARYDMAQSLTKVGNCLDVIKRRVYYGTDEQDPKSQWSIVSDNAVELIYIVSNITHRLSFTAVDIWDSNIAKLAKRYPDKFTTEKAVNRDVDTEMKAVTGN